MLRSPEYRLPLPQKENDSKAIRRLRWMILLLILELTFEGIVRKVGIAPNVAIFLLKDVIVAVMGIQVLHLHRPPALDFLWIAYLVEIVLFLPVIFMTAMHDPFLAVFGAKEYLLYPVVGLSVFLGFERASLQEFIDFSRWLALLMIPTTAIAILQLKLPGTSWLNLSVDGGNLEGFAAAGRLRVSSTFPFVSQYCSFLNAEVFIVMIALNNLRDVKWLWKWIYLSVVPLLVISSYVTGSRGSVLINCVIIGLAAGLSLLKFQAKSSFRVIGIILALLVTLGITHLVYPAAFEAYSAREQGQLLGASSEIQERIQGAMFDWMDSIPTTPFFGFGLGIMSNGSETISHYAAMVRALNWTETDFATTLFEGGIYLIFVWYGFRYFVIFQVMRRFVAMSGDLTLPAAFCTSFVIIIGLTGTLAIQPPQAIWWWLSVGSALVLWWKCAERLRPAEPSDLPPPSAPVAEKKLRGQSAYAERLHARKE